MKMTNFIIFALFFIIVFRRFRYFNLSKNFLETISVIDLIGIFFSTILFFILLSLIIYSSFSSKKNKASNKIFYYFKEKYLNIIDLYYYQPLKEIDNNINNILLHKFKYDITSKIDKKFTYFYNSILLKNNFNIFNKYFIFYFLCKYFVKLFVALIFVLDVFVFHKIYYFYLVMPFLIIPLILQYLKYVSFRDNKIFIKSLNEDIEIFDIIPSTPENLIPMLTFEQYLDKIYPIILEKKENPYKDIGMTYAWHVKLPLEKQKKKLKWDVIYARYKKRMQWAEVIHVIYSLLSNCEIKYDKYFNIIIFGCYFVSWFYISINVIFILYPYDITLIVMDNNPFI